MSHGKMTKNGRSHIQADRLGMSSLRRSACHHALACSLVSCQLDDIHGFGAI